MSVSILGRKLGMTRLYDSEGRYLPVTVIAAGPCYVSQVKTQQQDGYEAIQMAFEDIKGRISTMPKIGHDAKAELTPKRWHREVRLAAGEAEAYELGQSMTVDAFADVKFVDVTGTSKGKGFAGVVKRYGFKGQGASHGVERKHRAPGSIGGRSSNLGTGKPKKGIRMAGHMGDKRVTIRSLAVVDIDKQNNLLLVKGPIPGPKRSLVMVREAKRLYIGKARLAKAS